MPVPTALLAAALLAATGDTPLVVTATIGDASLAPGEALTLTIDVTAGDGWSVSGAGIPNAILQLDVPKAVTLDGKVVESLRDLARNEFLEEPYERMIEPGRSRVGFTLERRPDASARLGVNVVAYARREAPTDGEPKYAFVRRRVELPLEPGATASSSEQAQVSNWGRGRGLQIGETAPDFDLPRGDGTTVTLGQMRGTPVIVTTYRAFW
ncbi:MAG: hypothetical protein ACYTF9_05760 [Planctomycetota bacterium]|jgi:hypothetical protein